MKYVLLVTMSVCVGLVVVIALTIPLQAQMSGAPIPFSADWVSYIEDELQESGRFYATPEAVRVERRQGTAEEGVSFTTIWDFRKMVAYVLQDWHQRYFGSIIQPEQAGRDDYGMFGVPCPVGLGELMTTSLGSDVVQGRETEKWRCAYTDSENLIVWFDTRLQRTIRYEFEDPPLEYWEMRNIKEGPQPESLFVVPPDYSRR